MKTSEAFILNSLGWLGATLSGLLVYDNALKRGRAGDVAVLVAFMGVCLTLNLIGAILCAVLAPKDGWHGKCSRCGKSADLCDDDLCLECHEGSGVWCAWASAQRRRP